MAGEQTEVDGLAWLEDIAAGRRPQAPFGVMIGQRLTAAADGQVEFRLTPTADHCNPTGVVHGGVLATMLDSACGAAVHTRIPIGVRFGTTDLHVRLLRAPTLGVEVVATGEVVHLGRSIGTARGEVRDADGRLLATGTAGVTVLRP